MYKGVQYARGKVADLLLADTVFRLCIAVNFATVEFPSHPAWRKERGVKKSDGLKSLTPLIIHVSSRKTNKTHPLVALRIDCYVAL